MYAEVDGIPYETAEQANGAMDALDAHGAYYTVCYPDGALWEYGPNGHEAKLNGA